MAAHLWLLYADGIRAFSVHPDAASRERNFQAFMEDPEWLDLKERTEANGPLHEKIDIIYMNKAPFFQTE
ncbi:hypothetical protein O9H85_30115 [Paenibacillus filicis]|uniref:NIPSNAP domain-containing protein n=1 Tax=Paenibacillus gyeongsangnamensis TaxID=3388067 RepID=A0ABT4QI59_9BACL|nr:hypothetical protein [Paenibacillus filicis]MCZ8516570.1 hypothetical protein [Paenibacillus filicis]